jgi:hypothetical protein
VNENSTSCQEKEKKEKEKEKEKEKRILLLVSFFDLSLISHYYLILGYSRTFVLFRYLSSVEEQLKSKQSSTLKATPADSLRG